MTRFRRTAATAAAIVLAGFAFSSAFATDMPPPRRHVQVRRVKAPVVQPICTLLNGCLQLVIVGH